MTLEFTVRDPIATNRAYARSAQRRLFMTSDGKSFKNRVVAAAAVARSKSEWPSDPFRVGKARVSYQLFDYRGDTDGPRKLIRDCLEGVLYVNDRIVEDGPAPLPIRDGNGRRVEITVELLDVRNEHGADVERVKHQQRVVANGKRRAKAAQTRRKNAAKKACPDCNGTGIVRFTNGRDVFGERCDRCAA